MTGLILAAGLGERLANGKANSICKPLQNVNGIPLIAYSLGLLEKTGINKAIIVVGKHYDEITKRIGNRFGNMLIEYETQKEQKGLVNAILSGSKNCDDDVIVLLADELFVKPKTSECIELFNNHSLDYIATYVEENDPEKIKANFSIQTNELGKPCKFVEKPTETVNSMKGTGVCVFSRESIRKLKSEYDEEKNVPNTLCDFFNLLNKEKINGMVFEFADIEINVNTLDDLKRARALFETEGG